MKETISVKKLAFSGLLIAISVIFSFFYIPVGVAKCFPIQHMINVIAAVMLGPAWSVGCAFVTSVIRVSTGTGTLLAFPGSMCGALLAGLAYKYTKNIFSAMVGEILGTGLLGSLLAYPVAVILLGKEVAIFAFLIPFLISTLGGSILAGIILKTMDKTIKIDNLKNKF